MSIMPAYTPQFAEALLREITDRNIRVMEDRPDGSCVVETAGVVDFLGRYTRDRAVEATDTLLLHRELKAAFPGVLNPHGMLGMDRVEVNLTALRVKRRRTKPPSATSGMDRSPPIKRAQRLHREPS